MSLFNAIRLFSAKKFIFRQKQRQRQDFIENNLDSEIFHINNLNDVKIELFDSNLLYWTRLGSSVRQVLIRNGDGKDGWDRGREKEDYCGFEKLSTGFSKFRVLKKVSRGHASDGSKDILKLPELNQRVGCATPNPDLFDNKFNDTLTPVCNNIAKSRNTLFDFSSITRSTLK